MIRASIRRPVAVAMTYGAVAVLGAFAWQNIPIELYPDTQLPRLTVTGSWRGASPETVEAFLTSPVEAAIQQVRGVEKIVSDSEEGSTRISVEFNRDTDMDFARLDLAERMATLQEELPPTVDRITVQPYVPDEFQGQNQSLLTYTFTGPYTQESLYRHLDEVVLPELGQVQGVALARAYGGRRRVLEIQLDEEKVASLGLSSFQIRQAVAGLDLVREAGVVREGDKEWTLTIVNRPDDVDDIRQAILTTAGGTVVRVSDVATVHDTFEEARSFYRIDGRPALRLSVIKEIGANSVRVADAVKQRIEGLQRLSPFGARFIMDVDQSEDIRRQLSDLRSRALIAAVVIFVVLLLFLRSFRSAGLIFATIAFSVLIALNLIYFGGLSLNLLTLMGLAMGFGLIVDNSIVVLENVYRRWQRGDSPGEAAEEGAREVVLPILASTATTLIVFVPFVYLQGELRLYYVPLAVVVALTLIASLFVSFTFIPALAARVLAVGGGKRGAFQVLGSVPLAAAGPQPQAAHAAHAGPGRAGPAPADGGGSGGPGPESGFRRAPLYVRVYRSLIGFTLRQPWVTVVITVVCLGGSWYLFDKYVTRGAVWGGGWGSQRTYIDIQIRLPRGSNLERADQLTAFFEERLAAMPEVEQYVSQVSESVSRIEVTFPDSLEFTAVPVAIKDQMFAYSLSFTGADVRVYGFGPSFYGGGSSPPNYSITVLGYNFEKVRDIAEDIGRKLVRQARIQDVDTNASAGWYRRDRAMEYVVKVDRAALARHDMSVVDLTSRIGAFMGGMGAPSNLKVGGDEVWFQVKTAQAEGIDVLELRESILTAPSGRGIRLGDVAVIESREVLSLIHREDQQYERRVAYEFRGPRKLGDLYQDAVIAATAVPPGYTVKKAEGWRWSEEQRSQIYMVLLISVILVYMVTAALFESLRQPLCVLLTVPMALIGVFMMFFYTNATFTREAYIGVIMMGGIVVNNAILLVDHINRVREKTLLSLHDAVLQGTLERVRPILMTTATTVLGLLPLVLFSQTADANIWNALGYALIGGLLSSTLFVLTTTPSLYYLFERGRAARHSWDEQHRRADALEHGPGSPGGGAGGPPGAGGRGSGGPHSPAGRDSSGPPGSRPHGAGPGPAPQPA